MFTLFLNITVKLKQTLKHVIAELTVDRMFLGGQQPYKSRYICILSCLKLSEICSPFQKIMSLRLPESPTQHADMSCI